MEDKRSDYPDEVGRVEAKKKREIWKTSKARRDVDLRIGAMVVVVVRRLLKAKRRVFNPSPIQEKKKAYIL